MGGAARIGALAPPHMARRHIDKPQQGYRRKRPGISVKKIQIPSRKDMGDFQESITASAKEKGNRMRKVHGEFKGSKHHYPCAILRWPHRGNADTDGSTQDEMRT